MRREKGETRAYKGKGEEGKMREESSLDGRESVPGHGEGRINTKKGLRIKQPEKRKKGRERHASGRESFRVKEKRDSGSS